MAGPGDQRGNPVDISPGQADASYFDHSRILTLKKRNVYVWHRGTVNRCSLRKAQAADRGCAANER